jgi:hypothetical protein
MARIRTIKPEFWDSPGTARASLRARLFFISLWNWADDWGVGTANPKQLIGFAFPNDDDVTVAEFPRLRTEVADCYGVQWYEVENRPYYAIPSWDDHQKNERRANRRNPTPDQGIPIDTEMHGDSAPPRGDSAIGTGEQGNRGTGEQGNSPKAADAPLRDDVESLFDVFDQELAANGCKPLTRTKAGRDAFRLMLDRDGIELNNIAGAIRWAQQDSFWKANIMSPTKLREKYEQLLLQAQRKKSASLTRADENAAEYRKHYGGNDERAGSFPALDAGIG